MTYSMNHSRAMTNTTGASARRAEAFSCARTAANAANIALIVDAMVMASIIICALLAVLVCVPAISLLAILGLLGSVLLVCGAWYTPRQRHRG